MTLFADAVASGRGKLRRIDDRPRSWIIEVLFGRAVATLASDTLRREDRRSISIRRPQNMQCSSRVAKETSFGDWPREIWVGQPFVSRSQIVGLSALVISDGRLK